MRLAPSLSLSAPVRTTGRPARPRAAARGLPTDSTDQALDVKKLHEGLERQHKLLEELQAQNRALRLQLSSTAGSPQSEQQVELRVDGQSAQLVSAAPEDVTGLTAGSAKASGQRDLGVPLSVLLLGVRTAYYWIWTGAYLLDHPDAKAFGLF